MADINKRLLTSSDGIPAPQHKVKGESDFEFTEGSGGAQHTKIVDSSGQPISIDDELKSIKRTQAEILDRLDNGIDTRVTGSMVELDYNSSSTLISAGSRYYLLGQAEEGAEPYEHYLNVLKNGFKEVYLSLLFTSQARASNFKLCLYHKTWVRDGGGAYLEEYYFSELEDKQLSIKVQLRSSYFEAYLENISDSDTPIYRYYTMGVR